MFEKLTPWFPKSVKPVHVGVYEIGEPYSGYRCGGYFRYWDGRNWHGFQSDPYWALRNKDIISRHAYAEWRGLANKPKEPRHD